MSPALRSSEVSITKDRITFYAGREYSLESGSSDVTSTFSGAAGTKRGNKITLHKNSFPNKLFLVSFCVVARMLFIVFCLLYTFLNFF